MSAKACVEATNAKDAAANNTVFSFILSSSLSFFPTSPRLVVYYPSRLAVIDAGYELLAARAVGRPKNLFWWTLFFDHTLVQINHMGGHIAGEFHFMRHQNHGATLFRQIADDLQNF